MFWITLAAQLISAEPISSSPLFSSEDMPKYNPYVNPEGIERRVTTRSIVRPDGSLRDCGIESTSGDSKFDSLICRLIVRRGHYTPARWMDGSPVYGVNRLPVRWTLGPRRTGDSDQSDLDLTVNRFPRGKHGPIFVQVIFAADEGGKLLACAEDRARKGSKPTQHPELVQLACDQMMKSYTAIPVRDENGKEVRSVQTGTVRIDEEQ